MIHHHQRADVIAVPGDTHHLRVLSQQFSHSSVSGRADWLSVAVYRLLLCDGIDPVFLDMKGIELQGATDVFCDDECRQHSAYEAENIDERVVFVFDECLCREFEVEPHHDSCGYVWVMGLYMTMYAYGREMTNELVFWFFVVGF